MNQPSRYFEMDYEVPFPGAAAPFSEPEDSSDEEEGPHGVVTDVLNVARPTRNNNNDEEGVRPSQRRRIR